MTTTISKMDENLDNNPFYRALLSTHRKQFDIASKKCYIVAIPTSESMTDVVINNYVINSHILMPSRLLKMHYIPIEGGTTDIEIDTNKLILNGKNELSSIVRILREEIGYNSNNQQYRILIIDRPLIVFRQRKASNFAIQRQLSGNNIDNGTADNIKLTNHDDAHRFLERISQALTNDLETSIRTLQSTYLILPRFLDDASSRIKSLVDLYTRRFVEHAFNAKYLMNRSSNRANPVASILNGVNDDILQIAIEAYVVHLMHGRLIASIYECYRMEDRQVHIKCKEISSFQNVNVCDLGAQKSFRDFKVTTNLLSEVTRLDYLQSPLALVTSWTLIINLISDQLNQAARPCSLPTNRLADNQQVCICSDDLIASLVYTLAMAAPHHMFSAVKYVELFSWSSSSKDQAAYCSATFQLVTNYLMNYVKNSDSLTL